MKYLWTPYVCVFASLVVCDAAFYSWVLNKLSVPSKTIVSNVLLKFVRKTALTVFCWLFYKKLSSKICEKNNQLITKEPRTDRHLLNLQMSKHPRFLSLFLWNSISGDIESRLQVRLQRVPDYNDQISLHQNHKQRCQKVLVQRVDLVSFITFCSLQAGISVHVQWFATKLHLVFVTDS